MLPECQHKPTVWPRYLILEETSNNGRRDVSFFLGCLFGVQGQTPGLCLYHNISRFFTGKIHPQKWVCLKKMCLSKSPKTPPHPQKSVFSLDDSIKGVLSRLHSSYPADFEPSFLGGSQRSNSLNPKCCNATTNFCYQKQTGLEPFSQKT